MRRDGPEPPRARYPEAYRASESPNSLGSDWRQQQEEARFGVKRGRMAPLGQVIGEINRRAPGRQLDAGIEDIGGRPVYRVRWMTANGRRVDYIVDAATGAILGEH